MLGFFLFRASAAGSGYFLSETHQSRHHSPTIRNWARSWIVTVKPEYNKKKSMGNRQGGGVDGGKTPSRQIRDRFTALVEGNRISCPLVWDYSVLSSIWHR